MKGIIKLTVFLAVVLAALLMMQFLWKPEGEWVKIEAMVTSSEHENIWDPSREKWDQVWTHTVMYKTEDNVEHMVQVNGDHEEKVGNTVRMYYDAERGIFYLHDMPGGGIMTALLIGQIICGIGTAFGVVVIILYLRRRYIRSKRIKTKSEP